MSGRHRFLDSAWFHCCQIRKGHKGGLPRRSHRGLPVRLAAVSGHGLQPPGAGCWPSRRDRSRLLRDSSLREGRNPRAGGSKGGSIEAMDLFRSFRRQDPEFEPLLRRCGLNGAPVGIRPGRDVPNPSNELLYLTDAQMSKESTVQGDRFEQLVRGVLAKRGLRLARHHPVDVGVARQKREHKFDLGSDELRLLVECKGHEWPKQNGQLTTKFHAWKSDICFLQAAPDSYRKVFAVLHAERNGRTMLGVFLDRCGHLVTDDIEICEIAWDGTVRREV